MKSDQFFPNPFEQAEEWEESEDTLKIYGEYKDTDLTKLIEYYSNTEARTEAKDRKIRLRVLREIIAWKLKIPMFDYFIDTLNEKLARIERKFKELDKFSNHRHKTIMGLYTEKPVY